MKMLKKCRSLNVKYIADLICCHTFEKVRRRLSQVPTSLQCMTEHPGLEPNCLNVYTLQNINNIYRADYGPLRMSTEEE